jgi:hypothetical protein
MLTRFAESLGDKLAERFDAAALSPAFIFWAGGLIIYAQKNGIAFFFAWLSTQTPIFQAAILAGALLVVLASTEVVRRLNFPVLRFLEGYWPPWLVPLQRWMLAQQDIQFTRMEARFQELAGKLSDPDAHQDPTEYARLDQRLRRIPADPKQRQPTRLGNILRAA